MTIKTFCINIFLAAFSMIPLLPMESSFSGEGARSNEICYSYYSDPYENYDKAKKYIDSYNEEWYCGHHRDIFISFMTLIKAGNEDCYSRALEFAQHLLHFRHPGNHSYWKGIIIGWSTDLHIALLKKGYADAKTGTIQSCIRSLKDNYFAADGARNLLKQLLCKQCKETEQSMCTELAIIKKKMLKHKKIAYYYAEDLLTILIEQIPHVAIPLAQEIVEFLALDEDEDSPISMQKCLLLLVAVGDESSYPKALNVLLSNMKAGQAYFIELITVLIKKQYQPVYEKIFEILEHECSIEAHRRKEKRWWEKYSFISVYKILSSLVKVNYEPAYELVLQEAEHHIIPLYERRFSDDFKWKSVQVNEYDVKRWEDLCDIVKLKVAKTA